MKATLMLAAVFLVVAWRCQNGSHYHREEHNEGKNLVHVTGASTASLEFPCDEDLSPPRPILDDKTGGVDWLVAAVVQSRCGDLASPGQP